MIANGNSANDAAKSCRRGRHAHVDLDQELLKDDRARDATDHGDQTQQHVARFGRSGSAAADHDRHDAGEAEQQARSFHGVRRSPRNAGATIAKSSGFELVTTEPTPAARCRSAS